MAFQQGLQEEGFASGQTLRIEYRWAEGHIDRLPALVADLLRQRVEVIVATGGGTAALAAKAATTTVPIVFSAATDPVNLGLVASLNRPGNNVTGVHVMTNLLEAKRLGLLNELIPNAARIGVLFNPDTPGAASQFAGLKEATRAFPRAFRSLRPVMNAVSKRRSAVSLDRRLKHFWWPPIRSFTLTTSNWSHWRHAMPSRPCMSFVNTL
jgi:putative ABC transport system substrate-binding protein